MTDRRLTFAFGISSIIHSALLLTAPLLLPQNRATAPVLIAVQLGELTDLRDPAPEIPPPHSRPPERKISPLKLLSKPDAIVPHNLLSASVEKKDAKEPIEPLPEPEPGPPGPGSPLGSKNPAGKPGEAEGSSKGAGGGDSFTFGDIAVASGSGVAGGGLGRGSEGFGRGGKGTGSAGSGMGDGISSVASPAAAIK